MDPLVTTIHAGPGSVTGSKEEGPNPGQKKSTRYSAVPGLPGNAYIYILFFPDHGFFPLFQKIAAHGKERKRGIGRRIQQSEQRAAG